MRGHRAKGASLRLGTRSGGQGLWAPGEDLGWSPWQMGMRRMQTTESIFESLQSLGLRLTHPAWGPLLGESS